MKPGSLEISLGRECFGDGVLVKCFGLTDQWRLGLEIHVAAKIQELLMS